MKFSDDEIRETFEEETACRGGPLEVRQHLGFSDFTERVSTEGDRKVASSAAHLEVSRQARRAYERRTHRNRVKNDEHYRLRKAQQAKAWALINRERANELRRKYYRQNREIEIAKRSAARKKQRKAWAAAGLCTMCGKSRTSPDKKLCTLCTYKKRKKK